MSGLDGTIGKSPMITVRPGQGFGVMSGSCPGQMSGLDYNRTRPRPLKGGGLSGSRVRVWRPKWNFEGGARMRNRRPQEGNVAWKATMAAYRFKPGRPGHRRCKAMKRGTDVQCGHLALKGNTVCLVHGGNLQRWRDANAKIKTKRSKATSAALRGAYQRAGRDHSDGDGGTGGTSKR